MDVKALLAVLDTAAAGIDAHLPPVAARAQQLTVELQVLARGSAERADRVGAKAAAAVDFERVRALVTRGQIRELTAREAKAAARRFLEFEPVLIKQLLVERPSLLGIYARQLFADWERGYRQARWKHDVEHLDATPTAIPVRLAIKPRDLLGARGPELVAQQLAAARLVEVSDELLSTGLSPRWAYTHHAALRWWLAKARSRDAVARRLEELLAWEHRGYLLPIRQQTAGSVETRVTAVAEVLARLAELQLEVPAALELVLVEATFGDPRSVLTAEWEQVRARAREGFEAFTAGLIRQDLKFFFSHAMKEKDREEFWLQYLPSIRRTICILDAGSFERVQSVSRGLDEKTRVAARRAMRMNDLVVSAFCLVFDRYVVIEFSKTGNASYLYERAVFDRTILPPGRTRPTLSQLKSKELGRQLVHRAGWEEDFESALASRGIHPST